MRKTKFTKKMILDKAAKFVQTYGFDELTTRNLADYMKMSTQPIYKQFDSMHDLKQALVINYFAKINQSFEKVDYANGLADFALHFVVYNQKCYELFLHIFFYPKKKSTTCRAIQTISQQFFYDLIQADPKLCQLSTSQQQQLQEKYFLLLIGSVLTHRRFIEVQQEKVMLLQLNDLVDNLTQHIAKQN
ncbi:TetR/AcrR family transcriptional regulator [Enterococcus sp. SMC-9]|uniref:TetR/AcrR family transcriptional regulator n=1 Tax=Enterococcus sp. SMC-9 TaxID=2862343 RepID=UPI001E51DB0B|nr:TetR/AcrR family transcriptional regulator [Enterococcus sp. SMC-9]MCD1023885.1 TetR/AcrR family transcriptional regulator [Enterococcus sp. SMC-9]